MRRSPCRCVFQKIGSLRHAIITSQKLNIRSQNIFLYQGASRGYVPPSCARRRTASPGFVAMAEIITLQFGSYANYIGTHYWNFQVRLCLHGMQQRTARDPCVVLLVLRARMSSSAQRSQRRRLRPKSTRRCCTGKALTARCVCALPPLCWRCTNELHCGCRRVTRRTRLECSSMMPRVRASLTCLFVPMWRSVLLLINVAVAMRRITRRVRRRGSVQQRDHHHLRSRS